MNILAFLDSVYNQKNFNSNCPQSLIFTRKDMYLEKAINSNDFSNCKFFSYNSSITSSYDEVQEKGTSNFNEMVLKLEQLFVRHGFDCNSCIFDNQNENYILVLIFHMGTLWCRCSILYRAHVAFSTNKLVSFQLLDFIHYIFINILFKKNMILYMNCIQELDLGI